MVGDRNDDVYCLQCWWTEQYALDDARPQAPELNEPTRKQMMPPTEPQVVDQLYAELNTYDDTGSIIPWEHILIKYRNLSCTVPATTHTLSTEDLERLHNKTAPLFKCSDINRRQEHGGNKSVGLVGVTPKREACWALPEYLRQQVAESQEITHFLKASQATSVLHRDSGGLMGIQLTGNASYALVLHELCVHQDTGVKASATWWKSRQHDVMEAWGARMAGTEKFQVETCDMEGVTVVCLVVTLSPGDVYIMKAGRSGYTHYHQFPNQCNLEFTTMTMSLIHI